VANPDPVDHDLDAEKDETIVRLREVIRFQDRRLDEVLAENEALKRAAEVRRRADRRRSVG